MDDTQREINEMFLEGHISEEEARARSGDAGAKADIFRATLIPNLNKRFDRIESMLALIIGGLIALVIKLWKYVGSKMEWAVVGGIFLFWLLISLPGIIASICEIFHKSEN